MLFQKTTASIFRAEGVVFSPKDGKSVSLKHWHLPAYVHSAKTSIIIIIITITAVKTSNLS
jgi:hypothetical protein